jgi:hypothetical protein
LNALSGSHHNKTYGSNTDHDNETLRTAPEIEHFGDCETKGTGGDIGNNVNDGNQRMSFKGACHIWCEIPGDLLLESIDKVDEPNAVLI